MDKHISLLQKFVIYGRKTFYKIGPRTLKEELGFRVTLWIHPFINLECPSWQMAANPPSSFMVRDTKGKEGIGYLPGLVWWWQGVLAGYIDFTNPSAVDWWRVS
jgi:hypothetical protein